MSILIKGFEMPKHCWQCKFHDDMDTCTIIGENCVEVWGEYRRLDSCPLIPVPDHGRLIDADMLVDKHFGREYVAKAMTASKDEMGTALVNIPLVINNAPTIIPADHIGDANKMVADKEGEG